MVGRVSSSSKIWVVHTRMVNVYNKVDLDALPLAETATKIKNVMVVPFQPVIRIQTDLLTATSPLCDENKDLLPNIYAKANGPFLNFLKEFETSILKAAKHNAATWWPKRNVADMIDNGFKSYFKGDDVFKINVKTSAEAIVFDQTSSELPNEAACTGSKFWAVLEAHRVVLGKTEFGVVWKLDQMMLKPVVKCEVAAPLGPDVDEGDFL